MVYRIACYIVGAGSIEITIDFDAQGLLISATLPSATSGFVSGS